MERENKGRLFFFVNQSSKKPSFRSDRYQFTVAMPNLNYSVPRNTGEDSKISTEKIAMTLGVSSKTIKRRIKKMNRVNYIGRGSNGYWEITEKDV